MVETVRRFPLSILTSESRGALNLPQGPLLNYGKTGKIGIPVDQTVLMFKIGDIGLDRSERL